MNTIEAVNRYIARSKLPAAKTRYEMPGDSLLTIIDYGEDKAKKKGVIGAIIEVAALSYHYGMAAGYRMGTKYKGGTA